MIVQQAFMKQWKEMEDRQHLVYSAETFRAQRNAADF